jgi:phosphoribosylformylglycinamidine synthase
MEPFEVMTSESQERMLAIVTPANLDEVLAICARWEVRAAAIGVVTDTGRLRILEEPEGEVLGDVPASALHDDAPLYHRPLAEPSDRLERRAADPGPALAERLNTPEAIAGALGDMLVDPTWVYSQYDHQLFLNTVVSPGADAAVLRLRDPAANAQNPGERAIAMSADGNHRWCAVDPRIGTSWLVAESATNVAASGARALALVNCLNFGNPEHPEVMWQLSEAVDGMAEACAALGIPVVGGNVSLYNESRGIDIDPTPVVAVLGLITSLAKPPAVPRLVEGGRLILLGDGGLTLAGSRLAFGFGERGGALPALDFERVRAVHSLLAELAAADLLEGVHDVAEGGLALTLAEMAVRSGVGFRVARIPDIESLFGETPGRAVVCVTPERMQVVLELAAARGVSATQLGVAMGDELSFKDLCKMSLSEAVERWRSALPTALGSGNLA